ncbi:hypothetical protein [Phyllobacterium zundukense]|uniref:Uncharacterized protein n=1 Tax=Phyllobacterium zundukense TaxID=1867719 RepID=A0ACD4CVT4_9HYPH|nr:hypothetical protein [Phyllobacterium zundukense]UXN57712.1 hypothetical protein N8E88_02570 [Phyllobacterium zundukense]
MIAALTGIITTAVTIRNSRKLQIVDLDIKGYAAATAKEMALIAERQADLRDVELKNATAFRLAEMLFKRYEALRNDISDLRTMLDLYKNSPGELADAVRERILSPCNSISLHVSPKGSFDEEFNTQIEHIKAFLHSGHEYWQARRDFFAAFDLNCWKLVDAEFARVQETIAKGRLVERHQPEPSKFKVTQSRA